MARTRGKRSIASVSNRATAARRVRWRAIPRARSAASSVAVARWSSSAAWSWARARAMAPWLRSNSMDVMWAGAEAAFRDALTESLDRLEVCDRNLLRFHYFHGLRVDQLARVRCSPRTAVVRQLARIRERLLRDTRRGLAARLELDHHGLDRVVDVARSRLDLALARILRR